MATQQPNILIGWGDDIGWYDVSAYNHGVMGYRTPNIDRVAMADHAFVLVPAQAVVGEFLETFEASPPRQEPASFSIDQALDEAREKQDSLATQPHPATTGGGNKKSRPAAHA